MGLLRGGCSFRDVVGFVIGAGFMKYFNTMLIAYARNDIFIGKFGDHTVASWDDLTDF